MNSHTNETTFELAIIEELTENRGYTQGNTKQYDPQTGLFTQDIFSFLQQTQTKQWQKLKTIHGDMTQQRLIQRLTKEMALRGSLDVIRNGFTDHGVRFQLAFFKPESTLNPDTITLYNQNQLKVTRQVHYSQKNKKSVDLVLSLNGIPVATLELKNQLSGQNVEDAKQQYKNTRDPKELLFSFNKRTLVHFSVDDDEVYMTTHLNGKQTHWLPFNKGNQHGKGNPLNSDGYKTDYLWKQILNKDSWLEIIGRFLHLKTEQNKPNTLIFPRFHQLDAVRKITTHAKSHGAGHNYLIQHSAGSGKSNSIAWLAYRLASLHNTKNQKIFNCIIVITDRRILDSQLQNTIYQFEHKTGVVERIDKDAQQLAQAIKSGTHIIITTLQKFPFVIDKIENLPDRQYAVIVDEAHSSQGGEASQKLKQALSNQNTDNIETNADLVSQQIEYSANTRGQQTNLSFFAFTATPKYKTLCVFGHQNQAGEPHAFHLYPMRQAIEEGFILDTLQNYTTYQTYFKLSKAIEDDPRFNKQSAIKAIGRFVSLHPHNLSQKTEIMVEHFRQVVAHKIAGKAKAMLVTNSRQHAKCYFEMFQSYISNKGYDLKILVAFSGTITDEKHPEGITESQLNNVKEKALPETFATDDYKILIVADKYLTGFDQPLLHTMYIDKPLAGVKAVQTLSRLNRIASAKQDTFILDFANEHDTIVEAFQPYYETTTIDTKPDPNHLYDIKYKLDEQQIYLASEVENFALTYFSVTETSTKLQQKLYAHLDPAVDRYKALDEDKQEGFKKSLRTWTNLYAFLAQIMPFKEIEFEKFYFYAKYLQLKLPKRHFSENIQLTDEVTLDYYRIEKIKQDKTALAVAEKGAVYGVTDAGIKTVKDNKTPLSEIIDILNQRFGENYGEKEQQFFEQLKTTLATDTHLTAQATANKIDTFKHPFQEAFLDKLVDMMEMNKSLFDKIMEDDAFNYTVQEWAMQAVHEKFYSPSP
ncbi:MAG: type I restriction endonuclease [Thiotrichaceae bacterium]|nr:type I restriction endonuclease [Thiotrichaceae bacterium]